MTVIEMIKQLQVYASRNGDAEILFVDEEGNASEIMSAIMIGNDVCLYEEAVF